MADAIVERQATGRLPDIDTRRCTGCGWCVAACDALHLLSLETVGGKKSSVLHEPDRCTGCSACAVKCPFHVITMKKPTATGRLPQD
ncbi:4Fe-4S ferredoxin iron-sulfur binding domain protein [Leptothrix cholodnii SP-6]|uniref:4Fe-4S ferredoxin iron-sulfur binding domain protein n=1 Tax=Leptothrix cholodnii (strain ATCC 51168 / LMG 8142 / SP-6) TaxID=395495 RepID=B1Y285_LEPCP|nr:4Fe-4S dicluster domain-containing protein [Leptothrix cholodnii]ACB35538.1 4Fe-4S ferredoxin iron-sulfur binding domain protein [Leptothrix cholodnii SP-6]